MTDSKTPAPENGAANPYVSTWRVTEDEFYVIENERGQLLVPDDEDEVCWASPRWNNLRQAKRYDMQAAVKVVTGRAIARTGKSREVRTAYKVTAAYKIERASEITEVEIEAARQRVLKSVNQSDLELLGVFITIRGNSATKVAK